MNFAKRTMLRLGLASSLVAIAGGALAQDAYPSKPVRLVVGFAPGSGADLVARGLALKLGERLGQPVVVENKAAAGGMVSAETVAQAAPDGYTLLFVTGAITTAAVLNPNMRIDIQKDLAPVAMVGRSEVALLVGPSLKATSIADVVREAKARPGQINYGSSGVGGSTHFFMEQLNEQLGVKMTHVPYRGTGPAGTALRAGEIQVLLATPTVAVTLVGDQVKGLAITGAKRAPLLPSVPTFAEVGYPRFDASVFSGVLAPNGLPAPILARLNREINASLKDPETIRRLSSEAGVNLVGGTPAFFGEQIATSLRDMRRTAELAGIKAN